MERMIQDKDRVIASRERQHRQLNQHMEEQEQVTAEIQQTNHSLQRQVEQLQQQLSQQVQTNPDHKQYTINEKKGDLELERWRQGTIQYA